jgi:nucleotide-binding universal stress UspA family protein
MTVAPLVGDDELSIAALREAGLRLFGPAAALFAVEVRRSSVGPELAWGSAQPEVLRVPGERVDVEAQDVLGGEAQEQPLAAVGGSAVAVIEAAARSDADVVVIAADDRGLLARKLAGSATQDLVRLAPLRVLVVRVDGP